MGKMIISILAGCLLVSCSTQVLDKNKNQSSKKTLIDEASQLKVQNGKVAFETFTFRKPDGIYRMNCGNKTYRFSVKNEVGHIYIPASYFAGKTNLNCVYLDDGKKVDALKVAIEEFDYPKEKLNVAKGKVDYSPEAIKRIIAEKEIKKKIYLKSADQYLFHKPFMVPLGSFITSYYGNQRLFNNKKKSQHLGNDLRAATGTKIPSANRGKVVFTGDLFFTGKVVVIDHGMDIFSIYGHLSKILVSEGSIINQGDIVGLAGATGRVSGPHLHWGVKINGSWIDGFSLIEASKKHLSNES